MSIKGELLKTGSRTFSWRLFLGLIPEEKNFTKWVDAIRKERSDFYTKTEELKITKNKDLDPKVFNPLAVISIAIYTYSLHKTILGMTCLKTKK